MVADITVNTALDQQSKTAAAKTGLAEDFSQFLQLLTIQLQNQDPLNPMDTSEFTNQIVAFTGVEQQINTNQKLDSLVSLGLSNAMGSSLGYVGKDISYISSEMHHDGSPSTIRYALSSEAVSAKIRILDDKGAIVYEDDVPRTAGATHEFVWDGSHKGGGQADPGTYQIRIDALDKDGKGVTSTVVVNGMVRGIETQNGLLFALVGERAIAMSNILNVSVPETTSPTETPPPASEEEET
jgi:flagellar basal-body rod modification protein FlgD